MINLLPPQYKKYLAEKESYRLFVILMVLVFLFLISLSLILFSIKVYISGEAQNQKILLGALESEFEASETQAIEEEIRSVNQDLSKLSFFYESQPHYTDILEKIANILPEESYLTVINLEHLPSEEIIEVFLRGFSPNRELLSEFKSTLERQPDFYELDFPPSNWINPGNFSASFKVRPVK